MQGVFDGPMGADGSGNALGRQAGGGEAIAGGGGGFAVHLAGCGDAGKGGKAGHDGFAPVSAVREKPLNVVAYPVMAGRGPAMVGVCCDVALQRLGRGGEVGANRNLERDRVCLNRCGIPMLSGL